MHGPCGTSTSVNTSCDHLPLVSCGATESSVCFCPYYSQMPLLPAPVGTTSSSCATETAHPVRIDGERRGEPTLLQKTTHAVVLRRGACVVTHARTNAPRGAARHFSALVSAYGPCGGGDACGGIAPSISLLAPPGVLGSDGESHVCRAQHAEVFTRLPPGGLRCPRACQGGRTLPIARTARRENTVQNGGNTGITTRFPVRTHPTTSGASHVLSIISATTKQKTERD